MKTDKIFSVLVALLLLAEVVLVLSSWVLSVLMTTGVRSLLSAEGIRWFMGQFSNFLQTPLLSWLLLASMAVGCVRSSKLLLAARNYRERVGRRMAFGFFLIYLVAIVFLALAPHSVLLSATGSIFPSPFSRALIPIIALGCVVSSVFYGMMAQTFKSFSDVVSALASGIAWAAPLFIFYVLVVQLCESLLFVFA
jgi:aminobenzoyl-glutamate transport protein